MEGLHGVGRAPSVVCRLRAIRKTHALVQVALVLLDDPLGRHWGYDLFKRSGVRSGVVYPILQRMLADGWVVDGWEDPAEVAGRRPARRYYELTDKGRRALGGLLSDAANDPRFVPLAAWARGSVA
jgi:PadR family transcriptional regulator, regulatory protein PadR